MVFFYVCLLGGTIVKILKFILDPSLVTAAVPAGSIHSGFPESYPDSLFFLLNYPGLVVKDDSQVG